MSLSLFEMRSELKSLQKEMQNFLLTGEFKPEIKEKVNRIQFLQNEIDKFEKCITCDSKEKENKQEKHI